MNSYSVILFTYKALDATFTGHFPRLTYAQIQLVTFSSLILITHDIGYPLDPKEKILRIIMSAEDGLSGIERKVMNSLGWLWIWCNDRTIHFFLQITSIWIVQPDERDTQNLENKPVVKWAKFWQSKTFAVKLDT